MTSGKRVLAVLIALLGLSAAPASAQREWPSIITLTTLFGTDFAFDGRWSSVEITVQNNTDRTLSGVAVLRIPYGGSMRREVRMDVPAHDSRRATVPMFVNSQLEAQFLVDGSPASDVTALSANYAENGAVAILGEGTRLRGALLELRAYDRVIVDAYTNATSLQETMVSVGAVSFDPSTGDPRLPEDAIAYSGLRLLVAHVPSLRLANERQRAALSDWIASGGRLLVFPRTQQDLSDTFVRDLVGEISVAEASRELPLLVPDGVARVELRCETSQTQETFGCSRPLGFGRVFVASYDGMSDVAVDSGVTRELIRSLYTHGEGPTPALRYGVGSDHPSEEWGEHSFSTLRSALDPNESFRPGLILVALVLLIYVIVVGPINFRWVQKRNAPVLALLTTPLIAGVCVMLLVGVGYLGKGVSMRHRRVEIIELVEGTPRGHTRRYTGYYATRPGSFDLPALDPGNVARRLGDSDANGPIIRDRPDGVRLEEFRAGLWETAFVREDRMESFGGGITFGRVGDRIASVSNHTETAVEGAVIVDHEGAVYEIGVIPAGGEARVPEVAVGSLPTYGLGTEDDPTDRLADWMELDDELTPVLKGVMRIYDPAFVPTTLVLYGWLATSPTDVPPFNAEIDRRFIRVVPRVEVPSIEPSQPIESERVFPTEGPLPGELMPGDSIDPLVDLLNSAALDGGVSGVVDGGAP